MSIDCMRVIEQRLLVWVVKGDDGVCVCVRE
jgi:hypothetical protein